MRLAFLPALLCVVALQAQEVTIETTRTATEALRAEQRKLEAEEKAARALKRKPIARSGFLVELSRADDKKQFLSLRKPRDLKSDYKNIHLDERTARPKGFVLFSLAF